MKIKNLVLPSILVGATALVAAPEESQGFSLLGHSLGTSQADFRVFNNFIDAAANNNTVTTTSWPGWGGAFQSIWKGCVEWSAHPHAGGGGDPSQSIVGSGQSNFDPIFSGEATSTGSIGDNVHSALNQNGGGTLAFMQGGSFGWWCRYYENWTWNDGPGAGIGGDIDLQAVATHEYGHSLGLNHSNDASATMFASGGGVSGRSINSDDQAGIQAIYGNRNDSGTKPRITSIFHDGSVLTITCVNATNSNNQVWFTRLNPTSGFSSGDPIRLTGVSSSNGGTEITVNIPASAGPGDIIIRRNSSGQSSTSAPYPFDPFTPSPVPPMISSLSKSSVVPLTPNGGETLSIFGNDFTTVTDVIVDGVSLGTLLSYAGSWTIVDDTQIDIQMPLVPTAGMVDVTVETPAGSDTTQIDIVPVSAPVMAIEQPDVQSAVGLDFAVSAEVGDVIFLLFSPILGPTTFPGFFDWEIGGGNPAAIFNVKSWTIGPKFWRKTFFGPFSGLTPGEVLHFEGWVLEASQAFAAPWDSTNAVSRTVVN